jgi:hypothetical protein
MEIARRRNRQSHRHPCLPESKRRHCCSRRCPPGSRADRPFRSCDHQQRYYHSTAVGRDRAEANATRDTLDVRATLYMHTTLSLTVNRPGHGFQSGDTRLCRTSFDGETFGRTAALLFALLDGRARKLRSPPLSICGGVGDRCLDWWLAVREPFLLGGLLRVTRDPDGLVAVPPCPFRGPILARRSAWAVPRRAGRRL